MRTVIISLVILLSIYATPTFAEEARCSAVFSHSSDMGEYITVRVKTGFGGSQTVVLPKKNKALKSKITDVPKKFASIVKGQKFIKVKLNKNGHVEDVLVDKTMEHVSYGKVVELIGQRAVIRFSRQGEMEEVFSENTGALTVGDYVKMQATPTVSSKETNYFKIKVLENLGKELPAELDGQRIYKDFNIDVTYPKSVLEQAREIIENHTTEKLFEKGLKDYRDLEFITIDGPTTIDRDDAVWVSKLSNGHFKIYVAVPDLTTHIPLKSPIADHMLSKSTSHYLKEDVWHLLPPELTSKVLSIDPHQERAAVVFEMELSPNMKVLDFNVSEAVIRSRGAFTYKQIQEDMDNYKAGRLTYFKDIYELYEKTVEHGHKYLTLPVTFEKNVKMDERGNPLQITTFESLKANDLIEKFMILTNINGAQWMMERKIPAVFRGQKVPKDVKVESTFEILNSLDIKLRYSAKRSKYINYSEAFHAIENSPLIKPAAILLLQSTMMAENSGSASPHFFLNAALYAFLTSPLRRSSDFWNQHMIKLFFTQKTNQFRNPRNLEKQAFKIADDQNENMKKAKMSENRWLQVKRLRKLGDIVGNVYEGLYFNREAARTFVYVGELEMYVELLDKPQTTAPSKRLMVKIVEQDLITGDLIAEETN